MEQSLPLFSCAWLGRGGTAIQSPPAPDASGLGWGVMLMSSVHEPFLAPKHRQWEDKQATTRWHFASYQCPLGITDSQGPGPGVKGMRTVGWPGEERAGRG